MLGERLGKTSAGLLAAASACSSEALGLGSAASAPWDGVVVHDAVGAADALQVSAVAVGCLLMPVVPGAGSQPGTQGNSTRRGHSCRHHKIVCMALQV